MCLMYVGIFMSESTERSLSYVYSKPVSYYMDRSVPSIDRLALTRDVTQAMQGNKKDSIIVIDYKKRPLGIITISDILSKVGDEEIAETTFAKDIMSSPLLSIRERQTVQSALIMMRDRNIKHLPVLNRRGALVGMVSERTLSEAIRDATLKDARTLNPPIKAILGNLGFVLQFAGVLMLVPAMLATVLNDPLTATGIYISTVFLLVTGFFLNSYGEKSSLNMQQASILVFLSMFILILFGTLPYLYVAPHGAESALERFASSFFSSAAGFTTGGISLFEQPEDLPQSFTFYRSFTQLVGGMSFIYLVMTAFYPEDKMLSMRGFLAGKVLHLRELFGTITVIFLLYIIVMVTLLYVLGERNVIDLFSLVMSTMATGGFLPSSTILQGMQWYQHAVLLGGMILGALPFTLHYALVRRSSGMPKIGGEVIAYLLVLGGSILLFLALSGLDPLQSVFYTVSASTTAGLQIGSLGFLDTGSQVILIVLMFVGGCGFSTAGGIKVFRLIQMGGIGTVLRGRLRRGGVNMPKASRKDLISAMIVVGLFPLTAVATAEYLVWSTGAPFDNAFFEATGLITTGGLSAGVIDAETDPATKIVASFVMIFGRLEIIAILYIFLPKLAG